jgi:hypothetical protein
VVGSVMEKKLKQDLYIRICRDSGYSMDAIKASCFVAGMLKCSPLEIWLSMPSFSVMEDIAKGVHPICNNSTNKGG